MDRDVVAWMVPGRLAPLAAVAFGIAGAAAAEQAAVGPAAVVDEILSAERTILGQPLRYPPGRPSVTAAVITLPPGAETGWHTHAVPLFGYILEGRLTVDYGARGTRDYDAADGFMEAMDLAHNGRNLTDRPVRILAVYAGADGVPTATTAPRP